MFDGFSGIPVPDHHGRRRTGMAKEHRELGQAVVAVTGAAGGIGSATVGALSRAGAKVALGDLDVVGAQRVADGLYGLALVHELDVTKGDSFAAFLDATEAEFGPIDILINNAGIAPASMFADQDPEMIERVLDINLLGPLIGTQLAVQRMLPRGRGHVVNVASMAGKAGPPGLVTYAASKHGVVGLTETIRAELWGQGLDFTCVMPGPVDTQMMDGTTDVKGVQLISPADVAAAILDALRTGRPEVYVPKSLGAVVRGGLLLSPALRIRANRALGIHKIYTQVDASSRAAYEERMRAQAVHTPE
jgi:NAD(P)-dependent dehydrogenase (short-subunit alcohol dehydrogenase family)